MKNHYCPNVDRLFVCILLALIELTPNQVGIDFNLVRPSQPGFPTGKTLKWVTGHLLAKTRTRCAITAAVVYTLRSMAVLILCWKPWIFRSFATAIYKHQRSTVAKSRSQFN